MPAGKYMPCDRTVEAGIAALPMSVFVRVQGQQSRGETLLVLQVTYPRVNMLPAGMMKPLASPPSVTLSITVPALYIG